MRLLVCFTTRKWICRAARKSGPLSLPLARHLRVHWHVTATIISTGHIAASLWPHERLITFPRHATGAIQYITPAPSTFCLFRSLLICNRHCPSFTLICLKPELPTPTSTITATTRIPDLRRDSFDTYTLASLPTPHVLSAFNLPERFI